MSGFAVDWVWTLKRPRRYERLVLAVLASHARRDGICWPGFRRVADEAGIVGVSAVRIVRRVLNSLEEAGEIEARPATLDGRRIIVYRLAWPGRAPLDVDDYEWVLQRPFTADPAPSQVAESRRLRLVPPAAPALHAVPSGGFDPGAPA